MKISQIELSVDLIYEMGSKREFDVFVRGLQHIHPPIATPDTLEDWEQEGSQTLDEWFRRWWGLTFAQVATNDFGTARKYHVFKRGLAKIKPTIAEIPEREWIVSGKPTLDEYFLKTHGLSYRDVLRGVTLKKDEEGNAKPRSEKARTAMDHTTRVKLHKIEDPKGGESTFLDIWMGQKDATSSIGALAKIFEDTPVGAKQKNSMESAKYYIKRAIAKGNAEIIK